MNGPEHYRAAERIAAAAMSESRRHDVGFTGWDRGDLAALAQVHATLALAAATAADRVTFQDSDTASGAIETRSTDGWNAVIQ